MNKNDIDRFDVRFGGVEAAIFILLTTLNKQLEFEKSADIYMFAKLLYMKRPGVFRSKVAQFIYVSNKCCSIFFEIFDFLAGGLRVAVSMSGDYAVVEKSRRAGSVLDGERPRVHDNGSGGRGHLVDATHADGLFTEIDDDQGIRDGGGELYVRLFYPDSSGPLDGTVQQQKQR